MAYKPKPLTGCPSSTTDGNPATISTTVTLAGIAAALNVSLAKLHTDALKEQALFTAQACPAGCEKGSVTAPDPVPGVASFTAGKAVGTFDIKFSVVWTATVACVEKPVPPKGENIKVKQGGVTSVIGEVKYECIDGFIWVCIYGPSGKIALSRFKTSQACPPAAGVAIQEYTFTTECVDAFWWIVVTDPSTKKAVQKVKTETKCEDKKEEPKKDDLKKDK